MERTKEERLISFIKNNPEHPFAQQFILKMERTKEERLISFIKNNPEHPFAQQFILKKVKVIESEAELTKRLVKRNEFVLRRDLTEAIIDGERKGKRAGRKRVIL